MEPNSQALLALGGALRRTGYEFVTVTPSTHARVVARRPGMARSLRDVFGWSLPFERATLAAPLWDRLVDADALVETAQGYRSAVRFATLGSHLFVHSAYPTDGHDAVFFGPDTYRFCAMLLARAPATLGCVVDVGCGSGAGGILLASRAKRLVLADVNAAALRFAEVNAALAGRDGVETVRSDVLSAVAGRIDLVVSNPPYIADEARRLYRDGGGSLGEALSVRIATEALGRLAPGGRLLLYTGAPVVEGQDVFRQAVETTLRSSATSFDYVELDPDVFGEELARPAYASVERIAAVALDAVR